MASNISGDVKVSSRIVDRLSSGLYPSPAACLKELINNSYDADASLVQVSIKPDANQIVIHDDGVGFSAQDFERHFENISDSQKRSVSEVTKSGRKKIGQIGIGFISANELCQELEIISTCEGSKEILSVTIDFSEMAKSIEERKLRDSDQLTKAHYEGVVEMDALQNEHYTILILRGIREEGGTRKVLSSAEAAIKNLQKPNSPLSLYGMNWAGVQDVLSTSTIKTWQDFDFYSKTMLEVALNVPIEYLPSWVPNDSKDKEKITNLTASRKRSFRIVYDGSEIRKPILHRGDRSSIFEHFKISVTFMDGGLKKKMRAEGYFFASHGTIRPEELQGVLIRIRGAAVGAYDNSFMDFSKVRYSLIQRWVSSEIYVSDELEDAMNIDRATFRTAHPAYASLREAFHSKFDKFLKRALTELYGIGSKQRDVERRHKESDAIMQFLKKSVPSNELGQFGALLNFCMSERKSERKLKKYSASQINKLVWQAADGEISYQKLSKLLLELNKELLK